MIALFPGSSFAIEWIYGAAKDALSAYPGDLNQDMAAVRAKLDKYTESPSPANTRSLEKTAQDFLERSLKAFDLDWDTLREEFQTSDPQLADIARLFAGDDTPANRAMILLRIWKKITELGKFTIRIPENSAPEPSKSFTIASTNDKQT
jgi:hypothetical protein